MKRSLTVKITAIAAALCLTLGLCACSGSSASIIADGKVDNLRWAVDDSGCLSFTGTGAVPGVEYSFNMDTGAAENIYPAWYDYRSSITSVVIGPGIDSISMNAFMYFPALAEIDISATVVSIDGYAVTGCTALERVIVRCPTADMEKFCIGYTGGVADYNLSSVVFVGASGSSAQQYADLCGARFSKL